MNRKLNYEQWLTKHPNVKTTRGRDIGKTKWAADMLYIALPCSKCGNERWVVLRKLLLGRMASTLCRHCWAKNGGTKGESNPNWKGGRHIGGDGYVHLYITNDNFFFLMARGSICRTGGYVLEHRYVMAKHLNRCLLSWEIVHHKNGIRDDNRLENLELIKGRVSHHSYNLLQKELKRLQKENNDLRGQLNKYE